MLTPLLETLAAEREPEGWLAFVTTKALRECGRVSDAVAAFREAVGFDAEDDGARMDIADMLVGLSRWDEALASYEEVLSREPEDGCALPSALYVRVMRDGDPESRARLRALADEGVERASELLGRLEQEGALSP